MGAEFRNEKLKDIPDVNATSGNILGQGTTATDGKRDSYAAFAEFTADYPPARSAGRR